eukprot:g16684.t1
MASSCPLCHRLEKGLNGLVLFPGGELGWFRCECYFVDGYFYCTVSADGNFTTGDMGLYTLAFRASCINPANISNDNLGINLIRLLDTTLAIEMHAL